MVDVQRNRFSKAMLPPLPKSPCCSEILDSPRQYVPVRVSVYLTVCPATERLLI